MSAPLVIIGDMLLDIDLTGRADRLSPEAPVPVLSDLTERRRPGGAALAAWLAARSSSRRVVLIAPRAGDEAADSVVAMLGDQLEFIGVAWQGRTPVKTRIRIGDHPVARLDTGGDRGMLGALSERGRELIAGAAAILVCDYGRGATSDGELRDAVAAAAGRLPVVWDPHPAGWFPVPGCALVTPNDTELTQLAADAGQALPAPGAGGRARLATAMAAHWQARTVAVTLGAQGAMVCLGDNAPLMVSGRALRPMDTCGAGDSFAAAAALALADGYLPSEAVSMAVAAANSFVAAGAASAVRIEPGPSPRAVIEHVDELIGQVRGDGGTVVATGGCFDLLHAGHIATLEAARALGGCLIVCLNSDASVRRLKGSDRPLQRQDDRARVLRALQCVDAVVVFDEDTPAQALRRLRPDIWAKGGDYTGADLPEAAVLAEWGGEAVIVPYLQGRSTSALVELATRPVSR